MSFQNCKIQGTGVDPRNYLGTPYVERGNPQRSISSSTLREFAMNPKRWIDGYTRPDSAAMEWGRLVDTLTLTPHLFEPHYAVQPQHYQDTVNLCPQCGGQADSKSCRKCGKERVPQVVKLDWSPRATICIEWKEQQAKAGKDVITSERVVEARQAVDALLADDILRGFIESSTPQVWVTGEWHDARTGLVIPCQCLLDLVPLVGSEFGKCLADLKTCRSASPRQWGRWCTQAGYHIQAAWDVDMYVAATGEDRPNWCWLLSESFAPWAIGRRICSEAKLNIGRRIYETALARYAQCLKSGVWPTPDDSRDSLQGWTLVDAEPWEELDAASAWMNAQQEQEEATADEDPESDIVP